MDVVCSLATRRSSTRLRRPRMIRIRGGGRSAALLPANVTTFSLPIDPGLIPPSRARVRIPAGSPNRRRRILSSFPPGLIDVPPPRRRRRPMCRRHQSSRLPVFAAAVAGSSPAAVVALSGHSGFCRWLSRLRGRVFRRGLSRAAARSASSSKITRPALVTAAPYSQRSHSDPCRGSRLRRRPSPRSLGAASSRTAQARAGPRPARARAERCGCLR